MNGEDQADLTLEFNHHKSIDKSETWRKYLSPNRITLRDAQAFSAEFVGTFFLALTIATTKVSTAPGGAPFAIGMVLVGLVYTTAPISGGQLNPAVTIGLVVRRKLQLFEALYCIVSQIAGAFVAGGVSYALYNYNWDNVGYPAVADDDRRPQAFVAELLQTFCLVMVVLNTGTTKAQADNSYYGIAIGFVVLSGALVIGNVSGACFNPAVAMLTLLQGDFNDLWVFLVAPLIGGALAGLVFQITNPSEMEVEIEGDGEKEMPQDGISENEEPHSAVLKPQSSSYHNPEGDISRTIAMLTNEFLGTFFLTWTVALAVNNASALDGFIAVGAIIVSIAYSGGAISGSHYNPAVSLAVYLRGLKEAPGLMRATDLLLYIVVQTAAAFAGTGMAAYAHGSGHGLSCPTVNDTGHSVFGDLSAEFLFTFLLLITVLNVGTAEEVAGNSYFGIAIGFVIIAGQIAVADISGSVLNPAVAIALPLIGGCGHHWDFWIYLTAEFLAAPAAAIVYVFWYYKRGKEKNNDNYVSEDGTSETNTGAGDWKSTSKAIHFNDGKECLLSAF